MACDGAAGTRYSSSQHICVDGPPNAVCDSQTGTTCYLARLRSPLLQDVQQYLNGQGPAVPLSALISAGTYGAVINANGSIDALSDEWVNLNMKGTDIITHVDGAPIDDGVLSAMWEIGEAFMITVTRIGEQNPVEVEIPAES